MMKVTLATWLIFAASVDLVLPLQCYTCSEPMDVNSCLTVTHCPANSTACKTTVHSVDSGYPFFGNVTVSKSCSKDCVPSEADTIGENHPDYCCYWDLCNVGAGQAAAAEFSALSFTIVLAFSLLWLQG
ncbi:ly6/PLAUR domain-containing protein 2-like [Ahaetulla prasina]|uniref:ly6/PLAUR domain-containing protein 2-like n=1 Tax=Ahaetulla prasina TaxID=499056 RepID=UPI002647C8C2|nr:ly6/PLAUR domain-containing protein 2-like [Ahaetulla prasina]